MFTETRDVTYATYDAGRIRFYYILSIQTSLKISQNFNSEVMEKSSYRRNLSFYNRNDSTRYSLKKLPIPSAAPDGANIGCLMKIKSPSVYLNLE